MFRADREGETVKKPKPKKPVWDHERIKEWFYLTRNECFECGDFVGSYSPELVHHLILQQQQRNYRIDIINNEDNIVKVCKRCHAQAHLNIEKTPRIKFATEKIKADYLKF